MRYSGIQPQYFPRLHYFSRIINTDIFVIRDDVQFVRSHKYPDGERDKSYQAHSPIKSTQGKQMLTIPIRGSSLEKIINTRIEYRHKWTSKHSNILKTFYLKSSFFGEVYSQIKMVLDIEYENLAKLNEATIIWALYRLLGIDEFDIYDLTIEKFNSENIRQDLVRLKKIVRATELKCVMDKNIDDPNLKIISIMKEVGADEDYCGGTAVDAYIDKNLFKRNGIKISVQNWKCREYPQQQEKHHVFIPNLSIIDLLMNVSPEKSLKILG